MSASETDVVENEGNDEGINRAEGEENVEPQPERAINKLSDEEQIRADLATSVQEEYLPGAASLLEQLDKRILIVLRDGRHLVGKLRSFDQYMNLILEDTCERVLLSGKYCDFPLGLYIVRGDNIVLLGEIDADKESQALQKIDQEQYMALAEQVEEGDEAGKVVWDFE